MPTDDEWEVLRQLTEAGLSEEQIRALGGDPVRNDAEPGHTDVNQIAGGVQLWRVDGVAYLVYDVPSSDTPLAWMVESADRLEAIFGNAGQAPDKTLTHEQFKQMSPIIAGMSAEIRNTQDDPWTQFLSDFQTAVNVRPWLRDPSMLATMAMAYLEGRTPSSDELAQTDFWNNASAPERAWLEESVTIGDAEVSRRREDAQMQVRQTLRQAGVSVPDQTIVEFLADKALTGAWSETYLGEQIARIADPLYPTRLDPELQQQIGEATEMDTTRSGEQQVRETAMRWLGPSMGNMTDQQVREWSARLRNDPDAEMELQEMLQRQRFSLLPAYENPNLTYEDIIQPVRRLAEQVWGQPVDDETLLIDLANTRDYTEMQKRLRQTGLNKGIQKVVGDALDDLGGTALGQQVVRSTI